MKFSWESAENSWKLLLFCCLRLKICFCRFSGELSENCVKMQIFCCFCSNLRDKTWSPMLFEPSIDEFSWELPENCCKLQIFCWFGSNLRDNVISNIIWAKHWWILGRICRKLLLFANFLFIFDSNFIEIYRSLNLLSQLLMNSCENY